MDTQSDRQLIRVSLTTITLFLLATGLHLARTVVIPFVLALFLSFILQPFISLLQRKMRLNRGFAITIVCLGLGLLSSTFILLFVSTVKQLLLNMDLYESRLVTLSSQVISFLAQFVEGFDEEQLSQWFHKLPFFSYLRSTSKLALSSLSEGFLVAIFAMFLLTGPQITLPKSTSWARINQSIRSYLLTKFLCSAATGILTAAILLVFDIDMAGMFGVFAFVLNFIPTFGSIAATLLPVPIAFLQLDNPIHALLAVSLPGLVQFAIGNILEPKLMGNSLDLHPVTILLSLMAWSVLWGIPGMLLATPLTVIIKILLESQNQTKVFAQLMAGRLS